MSLANCHALITCHSTANPMVTPNPRLIKNPIGHQGVDISKSAKLSAVY